MLYDMKLNTLNIKAFIIITLLALGNNSFCQETTFSFDKTISPPFKHSPEAKDKKFYDSTYFLLNLEPTEKNFETYYLLACTMWELEKLEEAKKIFLAIVNKNKTFYQNTYYHSSDIRSDTTKKNYDYGSFSLIQMNNACLYLTKIYIEQKKFDSAYFYLNYAVKKYEITYSCGTGYYSQQYHYRFLYGLCYEGQKKETELLDLLLPYCFDWQDQTLLRAIKRNYSKEEIIKNLENAIKTIVCKVDNKTSSAIVTTNVGEENQKTEEIEYYSGTGKMLLFGKIIDLPSPDLNNGERLTKEYYIKLFKGSFFYRNLKM
jgi:tetratricopeptide (TPR) repeat protein